MDENESPTSFSRAFDVIFYIALLVFVIYLSYLFYLKLKERKLRFTFTDILKLIWLVVSLLMAIYFFYYLFIPEFSFEEANRKIDELFNFPRSFFGIILEFLATILVAGFMGFGVIAYFVPVKSVDGDAKNSDNSGNSNPA